MHGYVDFELAQTGFLVHDVCNDVWRMGFSGCGSSQPENGQGDGNSMQDFTFPGDRLSLRVERAEACAEGRVYSLTADAIDECGNVTTSDPFTVPVPHDAGRKPVGPACAANPRSNQNDTRPGWVNGTYGPGCR